MKKYKISYYSLGCKVNLYETNAIINKFIDNGFELVDFHDKNNPCDVCIINTCTVTQTSDSKSRKIIRQAIHNNPDAVICVMGCYSQLNHQEASNIDGVSIVTGTSNRSMIYDLVMDKLNDSIKEVIDITQSYDEINCYENLSVQRFNDRTRGFVKVQDGCENFCSYCTIPFSRGKFRSRDKDEIIKEIQELTNAGMKEIVLTGINTGAYGLDLNNYSFSKLLSEIAEKVENLGRIRISSIEATEVNDDLLNVIKENIGSFCMHLHIPLQGGCDETLLRMNRKYDTKYFKEKIDKIRKMFPNINITTDYLAGFSGETEEDFLKAYNFVKEISFGEMHVFPYSPRPKTKAYSIKERVDSITKKYRVNELLNLNEINALKYREIFLNKKIDCLVEKIVNKVAYGHSSNYLEIAFDVTNNNVQVGEIVDVIITSVGYPLCKGVKI